MKQPKRLTRQEKVEQAAAIKAGEISNPRHLIGIPPGAYHLVGEAAKQTQAKSLFLSKREFEEQKNR